MYGNYYRRYPALIMDEVMELPQEERNPALAPINFCQAVSSFNPFEHVEVHLEHAVLKKQTAYGDINGMMSLRQAISRYYQEKFNYDVSPARVSITVGASEALAIAFAMLLEKGGEIIMAESHFPPYRLLAHMFGAQCRFAPLNHRNCIDVTQLSRLITPKTQAILVNSPSNPHGTVLNSEELNAIAALGVPVIFDEVYQSLGLTNELIPSAISCPGQHIIINSFSKSLALAGFRVGYLIAPEEQVELMTNVKATIDFCTSSPLQIVCEALIAHWDDLLEKHRQMLLENWHIFQSASRKLGFNLLSEPQAGHFAMIDVSGTGRDSACIAMDLARYFSLNTAPGIDFQRPDPGFLRVNFACPSEHIEPGLQRLATYLYNARHLPDVYIADSPYLLPNLSTHQMRNEVITT